MDGYAYVDIARSGESNMEIDRQLLHAAERLQCGLIRLYRWREPTLSLGHFQATESRAQHAASAQLPLVVRASGGGAIVHDREWTYSIALPLGRNKIGAAPQLYDLVHSSLVSGLRGLGWDASQWSPTMQVNAQDAVASSSGLAQAPGAALGRGCAASGVRNDQSFLCFQRRSCGDIVCAGFKIVGSAQRRFGASVLQHGSILCVRSRFAPELPGLSDLPRSLVPSDSTAGLSQQLSHAGELEGLSSAETLLSWVTEPLVQHLGVKVQRTTKESVEALLRGEREPRNMAESLS